MTQMQDGALFLGGDNIKQFIFQSCTKNIPVAEEILLLHIFKEKSSASVALCFYVDFSHQNLSLQFS